MDDSFDSISEDISLTPDERSHVGSSSTRYREGSDVLIAAQALVLFSHGRYESIPGPSSARPSPQRLPSSALDEQPSRCLEKVHAGESVDVESTSLLTGLQKFLDKTAGESDPLSTRPKTPSLPRPHFKRILSNASTSSLASPSSPSHRPHKKSRPECHEIKKSEILNIRSVEQTGQLKTEAVTDSETRLTSHHSTPEKEKEKEKKKEPSSNVTPIYTDSEAKTVDQTSHSIDQAELQGHIISILALSRSSSMTTSAIVKQLLSNQPGLSRVKSKSEWGKTMQEILDEPCQGGPVFRRVERSGKVCLRSVHLFFRTIHFILRMLRLAGWKTNTTTILRTTLI